MLRRLRDCLALTSISFAALGCTSGHVNGDCDARAAPGEDDQGTLEAALSSLGDGQTLCLEGGRFVLSAPLSIAGRREVSILGAGTDEPEGTVLDFSGAEGSEAALSLSDVSSFTLQDVTIDSAPATGVELANGEDVTITRLTVESDGEARRSGNGLVIRDSARVRVSESDFLTGGEAGARIERSEECLIEESGAFDYVVGFALLDTQGCEVRLSDAEVNVLGVLVADDPSDPAASTGNTLRENIVMENTSPHPGRSGDSLFAFVPEGTGVLLLAADDTELAGNDIEGHPAAGALVLAYQTLVDLVGAPAAAGDYDGHPELVHMHDDIFVDNALEPSGGETDPVTALLTRSARTELADVAWDGALASGGDPGTICIRPAADSPATFVDLDARDGYATPSDDLTPHDCEHPGHGLVDP